jgi:Protein of unknown function (DUF2946)
LALSHGVRNGMKWFRSKLRHGSRLALFAFVVQFALSFGHFHGVTAQAAPAIAAIGDAAQPQPQPSSNHGSDQHPNDTCAICAIIAMANAVSFATPPALLLPQAGEFSYLTADAGFILLNSARAVFQPRAPPAS